MGLPGVTSVAVTVANLKLSTVAGTAFVDFSNSETLKLINYIGHKITILDHNSNAIVGYIKAAGTDASWPTNSMGSEKLSNLTYNDGTGLSFFTADTRDYTGGFLTMTSNTTYGQCYHGSYSDGYAVTQGMLLMGSASLKKGTASQVSVQIGFKFTKWATTYVAPADWATTVVYATAMGANANLYHQNGAVTGGTGLYDTPSFKQVTAPSTTGVTIVSARGGATFDWESISGSFIYNDASNYTYVIEPMLSIAQNYYRQLRG